MCPRRLGVGKEESGTFSFNMKNCTPFWGTVEVSRGLYLADFYN